jgi:hypothetical protein
MNDGRTAKSTLDFLLEGRRTGSLTKGDACCCMTSFKILAAVVRISRLPRKTLMFEQHNRHETTSLPRNCTHNESDSRTDVELTQKWTNSEEYLRTRTLEKFASLDKPTLFDIPHKAVVSMCRATKIKTKFGK